MATAWQNRKIERRRNISTTKETGEIVRKLERLIDISEKLELERLICNATHYVNLKPLDKNWSPNCVTLVG